MKTNNTFYNNEIWKDIKGYEGYYQISSFGRVRGLDRYVKQGDRTIMLKSKILKPRYDSGKYLRVILTKNAIAKGFSIHRLVAQHFIPNPDNLPEVNHKDENKENNNVDNLEWCTSKYNTNYGTRTERASKTATGKIISDSTRKKLSEAMKRRKITDETRKKLSDSLSKPVYQYTLDMKLIKIWRNAQEPKRQGLPFDPTCINKCCRGLLKTYKKYIWRRNKL